VHNVKDLQSLSNLFTGGPEPFNEEKLKIKNAKTENRKKKKRQNTKNMQIKKTIK